MKIIYISPDGRFNPNLFPRFKETFAANGHTETFDWEAATHCFVEVQSGGISYCKQLMEIFEREIPIICFDNREYGTMKNERWLPYFQSDIYFIRNMDKKENYPMNAYPFDWGYFPECDVPLATKDELFSRPYDIYFTGTESPVRRNVIRGLTKDGRLSLYCKFIDHTQRMPYNEWFNQHRSGKLFLSCEGGGYSNERPQQIFAIAPMLKNKSDYRTEMEYSAGINCLEISEYPTEQEIEGVVEVVNDKDWLYGVYLNGYHKTKKHLSPEGRSNYVLKTLSDNHI